MESALHATFQLLWFLIVMNNFKSNRMQRNTSICCHIQNFIQISGWYRSMMFLDEHYLRYVDGWPLLWIFCHIQSISAHIFSSNFHELLNFSVNPVLNNNFTHLWYIHILPQTSVLMMRNKVLGMGDKVLWLPDKFSCVNQIVFGKKYSV